MTPAPTWLHLYTRCSVLQQPLFFWNPPLQFYGQQLVSTVVNIGHSKQTKQNKKYFLCRFLVLLNVYGATTNLLNSTRGCSSHMKQREKNNYFLYFKNIYLKFLIFILHLLWSSAEISVTYYTLSCLTESTEHWKSAMIILLQASMHSTCD